jgi:hypothetical protein
MKALGVGSRQREVDRFGINLTGNANHRIASIAGLGRIVHPEKARSIPLKSSPGNLTVSA